MHMLLGIAVIESLIQMLYLSRAQFKALGAGRTSNLPKADCKHRRSNKEIRSIFIPLPQSLPPTPEADLRQGREVELLPLDGGGWVGVN